MTALAAHAGPSRWWHSRATHRFMSHRLALLGVAMITSLTLACVVGPYLLPYDSAPHRHPRPFRAASHRRPLSGHRPAGPRPGGAAAHGRPDLAPGGLLRHAAVDPDRNARRGDRRLSRRLDRRGADAHRRRLLVLSVDLPGAGAGRALQPSAGHDRRHHRRHEAGWRSPASSRPRSARCASASSSRPGGCWG